MPKKSSTSPVETAHFRFALIVPVIQGLFTDTSASCLLPEGYKESDLKTGWSFISV